MAKKQYLDLAGLEVYDEQIKAHIASLAEDSVYYVTATPNEDFTSGTVDKSIAQLEEAYNGKKVLICKVAMNGGYLMLPLYGEAFSNGMVTFGGVINSTYVLVTITTGGVVVDLVELAQAIQIPTSTSQLSNDSGFITNSASNLTNYYTKAQVDEKGDVALAFAKEYTDTVSQNALATVLELDETVLANANAYAVDLALAAGEDAKSWIATAKEEACAYTDATAQQALVITSENDATVLTEAKAYADSKITGHTHTVSHTPAGTVANTSVTPKGSVSSTFTGTAESHNHTFTGSAVTTNATPSSGTTTVYSITDVGTLPSCTYTAPSHSYTAPSLTATCTKRCITLIFNAGSHTFNAGTHTFNAGTLPTKGTGVSVATAAHTHSVTPAGTVANTSVTPKGSVSSTFTGTAESHAHGFTGAAATLTTSA